MPDNTIERPRVFVDKVHFKGYKSIEDLTIDFKQGLNILIGKNGSGKSNFLDFMNQSLTYYREDEMLFDYAFISFITNDNHSFLYELKKPDKVSNRKNELDEKVNVLEKFVIDKEVVFDSVVDIIGRKRFNFNNKRIGYGASPLYAFRRMGYASTFPSHIGFNLPVKLEYIDLPGAFIINLEELSGAEYSYGLNFLNEKISELSVGIEDELEKFEHEKISNEKILEIAFNKITNLLIPQNIIVDNIKRYCPIEDLRFNKNINVYNDNKKLIVENIKLEFKINGNWMPWSQLSDGTRRLFYIVAEVAFNYGLVIIEEPELGIHPHQFNLLMDFLKEQSESKQILISTHSPKALDHLSPEELDSILIASYDLKKGTQIRHLTSKEINKAKKYMKEVGFFSDYWMLSDLEE